MEQEQDHSYFVVDGIGSTHFGIPFNSFSTNYNLPSFSFNISVWQVEVLLMLAIEGAGLEPNQILQKRSLDIFPGPCIRPSTCDFLYDSNNLPRSIFTCLTLYNVLSLISRLWSLSPNDKVNFVYLHVCLGICTVCMYYSFQCSVIVWQKSGWKGGKSKSQFI